MFGHVEENIARSKMRDADPPHDLTRSDRNLLTPGSLQVLAVVIEKLLKFSISTILVTSSLLFPHLLAIVAFLHGSGELKI